MKPKNGEVLVSTAGLALWWNSAGISAWRKTRRRIRKFSNPRLIKSCMKKSKKYSTPSNIYAPTRKKTASQSLRGCIEDEVSERKTAKKLNKDAKIVYD